MSITPKVTVRGEIVVETECPSVERNAELLYPHPVRVSISIGKLLKAAHDGVGVSFTCVCGDTHYLDMDK